ncbi:MAG: DUF434 domain-containing protein [Deltaproteobacteria bacterium]|nr:DUF434 domain-containing protein [Deltaproteobacteria bacterium]
MNTYGGRGPSPEDPEIFSSDHREILLRAAEDIGWLLARGYPMSLAVQSVGDHHRLHARARLALTRGCAVPSQARARVARRLAPSALAGMRVDVDGFNVIIALEVARGRGALFRGVDSALRDLAGLRGSYRLQECTTDAVRELLTFARDHGVATLCVWLDSPVSNSGRLSALLAEQAARLDGITPCDEDLTPASHEGMALQCKLVRNADASLADAACAMSADCVVIDRAQHWIDGPSAMLASWAPHAWVIDLSPARAIDGGG